MKHTFTRDVSVPGVAWDRRGYLLDAHAAGLMACARCGVIEARVRVPVLGEITYVIARGVDALNLHEGAHPTCGGAR